MIHVTSPYLPSMKKYIKYVEGIYKRKWLTNNGPLVKELTARLEDHLGVKHLLLVSSGTMALQIAFRVKNLHRKHVITTPFTFQATYSALEWQGANIDFCDIDSKTWNLDPDLLYQKLKEGKRIDSIVAVHTFGNPCELSHLKKLQEQYGFSLIYDSAHALTTLDNKGNSILNHGDISCFSLHATKLFHTVEGGGIIFNNTQELEAAKRMINFGLNGETATEVGINGKMSEFHAAMGLAMLDDLTLIEEDRERQKRFYYSRLHSKVSFQTYTSSQKISPSYMPILFEQKSKNEQTIKRMNAADIFPRRYFYPSLNMMPIVTNHRRNISMPSAESVSQRILCLPLYYGQKNAQIEKICRYIS